VIQARSDASAQTSACSANVRACPVVVIHQAVARPQGAPYVARRAADRARMRPSVPSPTTPAHARRLPSGVESSPRAWCNSSAGQAAVSSRTSLLLLSLL
jgi:hypothetical protein